jgi:hypothetical protein
MRFGMGMGLGLGAQRGGGGFSPSKIAGMVAWFDAAYINLNNNEPVSKWENRIVGNGNLTQNVAIRQPAYLTNGQNGLPVVRFGKVGDDAANADFMESGIFGITGAYTIIIAGSFEGKLSGTSRAGILYHGTGSLQLMNVEDSNGRLSGYIPMLDIPSPNGSITSPSVIGSFWNGSNYMLANGVTFGNLSTQNASISNLLTWGMQLNIRHLLGSMYEICIYSRALSTGPGSEHEAVVNYLKAKWGIA